MLDVDGVLVTGRPEDGAFWATGLQRDLGIDPETMKRELFDPYWADIVIGRADLRAVLDAVMPRLSQDVPAQRFLDYWFEKDARVDAAVLSDVGVLRNRGWQVVLATNQERLRAGHLMEGLGLARHVDGIVYSAAVGARKPDPAFFHACSAARRFADAPCVLVDDTPANVAAARSLGWTAVQWTGAERLRDVVPAP